MRITRYVGIVALSAVVSGCGASGAETQPVTAVTSTPAATRTPVSSDQAPSQAMRVGLPPGFPLMPDAKPAALPEDVGVFARWRVPVVGSAAYDFYTRALPAAGFEILGTYPSERAALLRIRDRSGAILQVLAELSGEETLVTVQVDRP